MLRAMASPPRTREEERRLNVRTLAIASAASASAAAVTSQLWIAGTWIAAAITPLIVAVVSELLHRPTERIARAITSDRPALAARRHRGGAGARHPPGSRRPAARHRCASTASRRTRHPPADRARGRGPPPRSSACWSGRAALTVAELLAGQSHRQRSDSATSLGAGKARNKSLRESGADPRARPAGRPRPDHPHDPRGAADGHRDGADRDDPPTTTTAPPAAQTPALARAQRRSDAPGACDHLARMGAATT